MQLTLWTYEGPPHIGAMRVATAMQGLHYVLHAPQGDTYADLLFTMIERRGARPPVTYTTFQARDLGGDTAELFKTSARDAYERFAPQAMIVGASCTAELIQDDPGGLAKALNLPIPVIGLELPAYQKKENWGAAETFYRLVRNLAGQRRERSAGAKPSCNLLGPTALGFRHRDDIREITRLLERLGVEVTCGGSPWSDASRPHKTRRSGLQRRSLSRDRIAGCAMAGKESWASLYEDHANRCLRYKGIHRGSGAHCRRRSHTGAERGDLASALVFALS